MEREINAYIQYLLDFYKSQSEGLIPREVRPNTFNEITSLDEPSYLDDLVDVIEKLK